MPRNDNIFVSIEGIFLMRGLPSAYDGLEGDISHA
jgi:hypothetical protein